MSVTYTKGDLLDFTSWNVATQIVNRQGVMGAGLGLAVKERYPAAFEVYRNAFEQNELQMGTFTVALVDGKNRIINLVAQDKVGTDSRKIDYEALYNGLETIKMALEYAGKEGRVYRLGIPYMMGCGLAGGSFTIIEAMIQHLFAGSSIEVFIVEKVIS